MPDIFDEVDQDLRAERARDLLRRYWIFAVAAMVLIVLGIASWEGWQWRQGRLSERAATDFIAAAAFADALPPTGDTSKTAEAVAHFRAIAARAPAGYRTLARLRAAGLLLRSGDLPGAEAEWDAVAADGAAPHIFRELANLQWAQHAVDAGDPAAVEARLLPLTQSDSTFHALALETRALLSLRQGKADAARDTLRNLAIDPLATAPIRDRARGMLVELGETPPPEPQASGPGS